MATAQDCVEDALMKLKVYSPGQSIDNADVKTGWDVLNDLLEWLSTESAACYAVLEQSSVLTPGKSSYTIGTGGDFNMTRPLKLLYGPGAARIKDTNGVQYKLDVWPQDRWNQIAYPDQEADVPTVLFYDPQYPLGILNFYNTPSMAYTAYWDSNLMFSAFTSYTQDVALPPGYIVMLKANLAVWLKPYYRDAAIDPLVVRTAERTLKSVKRVNRRLNLAHYDDSLMVRGNVSYNIYNDSYSR